MPIIPKIILANESVMPVLDHKTNVLASNTFCLPFTGCCVRVFYFFLTAILE